MSPRTTLARFALCSAIGCSTPPSPGGFGSDPLTTAPGSTGSGTGPGGESSTSSSAGNDLSSTSTSGSSTTLILDVGGTDLGPVHPKGCEGKIDFLFVISRFGYMDEYQARLVDAFPKFIDTIQSKFPDFDYHIMVVDGDGLWGSLLCTPNCPVQEPEPNCIGYPCDLLDIVTTCDATTGAGAVFNAGWNATNKPCEIMDGRRYLTKDQPDLSGTFDCVARVGQSGYDMLGDALVQAISPALNGPGGCNDGFLRDDAILVVTLVTNTGDDVSVGTPAEWAQAVIDAKGGDLDAVVMFGIGPSMINGKCQKVDTVCQAVAEVPYSHWISILEEDYAPGFDVATGLVETACSKFIPQ